MSEYEEILKKYPLPISIKKEIKSELERIKANKELAEKIARKCYENYLSNLIEPGEAAGIVAAQSIGEPGTQMSLPPWERVIIKENKKIKIVEIGKFVDEVIRKHGCRKLGTHEVCDLPTSNFQVLSLEDNEKLQWKEIVSCIRHEFEGDLLEIKTKSGRKIIATPYHSFVTKSSDKIIPIEGSKLKLGDKLPVIKQIPSIETREDQFYALMSKDTQHSKLNDQVLSIFDGVNATNLSDYELLLNADERFVRDFIRDYFNLAGRINSARRVARFYCDCKELLDVLSFLLARYGIFTVKKRINSKFILEISSEFIDKFTELLVCKRLRKAKKIDDFSADVVWDEIVSIRKRRYKGKVYDISVKGLETFATFEGIITHNTMRTFHYAGVAEIDVTLGLPRLIEILDVRKNPSTPMMTIRLTEEYARDREKAKEVANRIEATYALDIADIITDIRNMAIIINLKEELLKRKQLGIEEIRKKLEKNLKVEVKEGENKYQLILQMPEPSYKLLMDTFDKLKKLVIAGIKEIKRVIIRKEKDEYVLYTEGSNLKKVMKVKGVDFTRTLTNNIYEI